MPQGRQGDSCSPEADSRIPPRNEKPEFFNGKPRPLVPLSCLNLRTNPHPSPLTPRPRPESWARIYLQTGSCGLSETPGASLPRGGGLNRVGPTSRPQSRVPLPKSRQAPAGLAPLFLGKGLCNNFVYHWLCFFLDQSAPNLLHTRCLWQPEASPTPPNPPERKQGALSFSYWLVRVSI